MKLVNRKRIDYEKENCRNGGIFEQSDLEVLEYDEQLVRQLIKSVSVYEEKFEVELNLG